MLSNVVQKHYFLDNHLEKFATILYFQWILFGVFLWISASFVSFSQNEGFFWNPKLSSELCALFLILDPFFFPYLPSLKCRPAPDILSLLAFDILVAVFSYCCPTLVVRRAVLLSQTLGRGTGLYNQRWVCAGPLSLSAPSWMQFRHFTEIFSSYFHKTACSWMWIGPLSFT